MALLGAIACQSLLAARKVRSADSFRPSIYLLGLAGTGSGKDYPRAVNQYILDEVGLGEHIPETCASGEGLEDAIVSKGTLLLQTDEINFTFSSMASGKESRFASLEAIILKLYSSSHKVYTGRLKANHIGKAQTLAKVYEPGLTIFGTSTPQRFYRALTLDMIEGGLASRCLVVEGENRGKSKRQLELSTMPSEILDIANHWATYSPKGSGDLNGVNSRPTLAEIALTPQAVEKMESFRQYCDEQNIALAGNNKFVEAALWTRVYENAGRLALIHACSSNHQSPVIDEQAALWAGEFSKWTVEQTIRSVSQNLSDNKFHGECQKIKKIVRDNGGSITRRILMQKAHMSKTVVNEIIETLVEAGTLGVREVETNTKWGLAYQLFDDD